MSVENPNTLNSLTKVILSTIALEEYSSKHFIKLIKKYPGCSSKNWIFENLSASNDKSDKSAI